MHRRMEIREELLNEAYEGTKFWYKREVQEGLLKLTEFEVDLLKMYVEEKQKDDETMKELVDMHHKITSETVRSFQNYQRCIRMEDDEKSFLTENFYEDYKSISSIRHQLEDNEEIVQTI